MRQVGEEWQFDSKEPVWSFSKFSEAGTPWKRKNCRRLIVFFFQQSKKLPTKSFEKAALFCAIRCFIAENCSFFDKPNRVSKNWHFFERNNSGVIDFADQLDSQFFRDLRKSVCCTWKFLSYKSLTKFFPQMDLGITDW